MTVEDELEIILKKFSAILQENIDISYEKWYKFLLNAKHDTDVALDLLENPPKKTKVWGENG